jgi:hypothetical protein
MSEVATWIVQLFIDGPVSIQRAIRFQHPKGFGRSRQFYSDIGIQPISSGLRMSVTAYARESDLARKAALVFVGEMLDVLASEKRLPLRLSLYDSRAADRDVHSVKRVLEERNFSEAFNSARSLSEEHPTFLRALGWYRKGLITEDPLDRFLALWNSIEIVAGKYHPTSPETKKGSKSQIWECFKVLWNECPKWPIIPDQQDWIDENYELRNQIAHGTASVDIDQVERAMAKAETIREVAQLFLKEWREQHLRM